MLSYSVNVLLMFIILIPLELLAISAYSLYTLSGLKVCGNTEETELKIKHAKTAAISGIVISSIALVGMIYLGSSIWLAYSNGMFSNMS
jgi:hypothetical protein